MGYKKPKRLKKGDTVAVVSPSWGGPSVFPYIYENALRVLEEWGLKIKEYPTTRASAEFLHANPQKRAEDLNQAFADPEIKAIFVSIGGKDSVRILPYLDKETIQNNPKIFLGFSDTTTMHVFFNQLGLVTFYGPSIMAGFSQMDNLPAEFKNHVYEILFDPKASYSYNPYNQYCEGYPDWSDRRNVGKVKRLKQNSGWRWLQRNNSVSGELFGGCLDVLEMIKATDFWPEKDFWDKKIFFLETSESKPSLHQVDHVLRNYGMQGIFDRISGLIFARARDYSEAEKSQLENMIVSIVSKEFGRPELPIVANFDFGHTDPQLILPLGVKAKIDPVNQEIGLIESWLS